VNTDKSLKASGIEFQPITGRASDSIVHSERRELHG